MANRARLDGKLRVESPESVPCGDLRRRRSNVVGWSSPTSTPRWTSRHRSASGKRECPSRSRRRVRARMRPGAGHRARAHSCYPRRGGSIRLHRVRALHVCERRSQSGPAAEASSALTTRSTRSLRLSRPEARSCARLPILSVRWARPRSAATAGSHHPFVFASRVCLRLPDSIPAAPAREERRMLPLTENGTGGHGYRAEHQAPPTSSRLLHAATFRVVAEAATCTTNG